MTVFGVVLLVLIAAVVVAVSIHLWRRPGPDARGETRRPVSERTPEGRVTPEYPGMGRPGGPAAEGQRVSGRGEVTPAEGEEPDNR